MIELLCRGIVAIVNNVKFCFLGCMVLFLLIMGNAFAQAANPSPRHQSPVQIAEYGRSSLTFLLLETEATYSHQRLYDVFRNVVVPDKFNNNNLETRGLQVPGFVRIAPEDIMMQQQERNQVEQRNAALISNKLQSVHIPNQIIGKWWSRDADGTFGVEILQERGAYDATDAEIIAARAGKRGLAAVMDAGINLINRSYVIVFDVYDLKTMEQHYNEMDEASRQLAQQGISEFRPVTRSHEGYRASVGAHLFKIDYNDSINAVFLEQMWIDPQQDSPDQISQKRRIFDGFYFPVKYVTTVYSAAESTQDKETQTNRKSDDELFAALPVILVEDVVFRLAKEYDDFRVRTALFGTRPLEAKIGLKEGLWVDQRYFVYEFQLNQDGERVSVRKGVIRATDQITDNRRIATGDMVPSRFYQTAGRRLDEGMLLEQRNDFGIGITGGFGFDQTFASGLNLLAEINVSQLAGRMGNRLPHGIKAFVDLSLDNLESPRLDVSLTTVAVGLSRDIYFLRNAHLTPFAGIGYESTRTRNDGQLHVDGRLERIDKGEDLVSIVFASVGFRMGLNILHNLQLVPSISLNLGIGNYETGFIIDNENLRDREVTLPIELQTRKGGLQSRIGLRYQF